MRAKEFISEKKRKNKSAAWGPGPYGYYGVYPGYSGDSGEAGDGGGSLFLLALYRKM